MKRILVFFIIVLAALSAGFALDPIPNVFSVGTFSKYIPYIGVELQEKKPQSLTFVGDVMLARHVENFLDTYGSSYTYEALPQISSSTVLVGNFESSIPEIHISTPSMTFSFATKEEHIQALSSYGFLYMSLANNHSYDNGREAFTNTQEVLKENDIITFGNPIETGTSSIQYVELEDTVVALIGFYTLEGFPGVKVLENILQLAQKNSDVQFAYIHWGTEYELTHSASQERFAHQLIDLGVDAVIGHHPHVVQDIETYKGVTIFYSLGNFIFDQYFSQQVQEGLLLEVSVSNVEVQYTLQGITTLGSKSTPRRMSKHEEDIFLKSIAKRSDVASQELILRNVVTFE